MPRYFEYEVSLKHIEPRIWRRFLLAENASFLDLHDAIQTAGDWMNGHLFGFYEKGPRKGTITEGDPDGGRVGKAALASYFTRRGRTCLYLYDFGDSWEVEVELKGIIESEEDFRRRLVGGERAFPLDDSGGLPGYYESLVAVGALQDESYGPDELEERREWLGDWNPEDFDLEKTKKEFDLPKVKKGKAK